MFVVENNWNQLFKNNIGKIILEIGHRLFSSLIKLINLHFRACFMACTFFFFREKACLF